MRVQRKGSTAEREGDGLQPIFAMEERMWSAVVTVRSAKSWSALLVIVQLLNSALSAVPNKRRSKFVYGATHLSRLECSLAHLVGEDGRSICTADAEF